MSFSNNKFRNIATVYKIFKLLVDTGWEVIMSLFSFRRFPAFTLTLLFYFNALLSVRYPPLYSLFFVPSHPSSLLSAHFLTFCTYTVSPVSCLEY